MNYPFRMVCTLLRVVFMYLLFQSLPEVNRIIKSPRGFTGSQKNKVVAWLCVLMHRALI